MASASLCPRIKGCIQKYGLNKYVGTATPIFPLLLIAALVVQSCGGGSVWVIAMEARDGVEYKSLIYSHVLSPPIPFGKVVVMTWLSRRSGLVFPVLLAPFLTLWGLCVGRDIILLC